MWTAAVVEVDEAGAGAGTGAVDVAGVATPLADAVTPAEAPDPLLTATETDALPGAASLGFGRSCRHITHFPSRTLFKNVHMAHSHSVTGATGRADSAATGLLLVADAGADAVSKGTSARSVVAVAATVPLA